MKKEEDVLAAQFAVLNEEYPAAVRWAGGGAGAHGVPVLCRAIGSFVCMENQEVQSCIPFVTQVHIPQALTKTWTLGLKAEWEILDVFLVRFYGCHLCEI